MQYQVITQHFGDKQYFEGDVRIVDNELVAAELIKAKLIAPMDNQQPTTKKTKKKADDKGDDPLDNPQEQEQEQEQEQPTNPSSDNQQDVAL